MYSTVSVLFCNVLYFARTLLYHPVLYRTIQHHSVLVHNIIFCKYTQHTHTRTRPVSLGPWILIPDSIDRKCLGSTYKTNSRTHPAFFSFFLLHRTVALYTRPAFPLHAHTHSTTHYVVVEMRCDSNRNKKGTNKKKSFENIIEFFCFHE